MPKINSKQKGKVGERLWRDKLREYGYVQAYRSQQYCGSADSADVICPELASLHFEVKNTERLQLWEAMHQAIKDAGTQIPIIAYKKNHHEWLVTMRGNDWLSFVKESNYFTKKD